MDGNNYAFKLSDSKGLETDTTSGPTINSVLDIIKGKVKQEQRVSIYL